MTTSAEFREQRARQEAIEAVVHGWAEVTTFINNNHLRSALDRVNELIPMADGLGADFTVSQWPHCLACSPPGSAEVPHPHETQRRLVCYLAEGDVAGAWACKGNRYGRMHPVQLREHVERLLAVQNARPALDTGEVKALEEPRG